MCPVVIACGMVTHITCVAVLLTVLSKQHWHTQATMLCACLQRVKGAHYLSTCGLGL